MLFIMDTHEIMITVNSRYSVKVLHIDDSPEICELYTDMFRADNNEITSVNNGKEGLSLILKNDYDLILLDMCMPGYSGMQLVRDLKKQKPTELRKVVVVSMLRFNASQIEELLKIGIHSVESKPTDLQKLEIIKKNVWLK